jgi:DNA-binding PadR family transcriptional regulator
LADEKKKRFSSEYTMLSILEYLCTDALNRPVTKYHIITKVREIKQQRPDRISYMMDSLEKNGFIISIKISNSTYYQATEKGVRSYTKWAKEFLDFARLSYGL